MSSDGREESDANGKQIQQYAEAQGLISAEATAAMLETSDSLLKI